MIIFTVINLDEPVLFVVFESWDCGIHVDAFVGRFVDFSTIISSPGQFEASAFRAHHRLHDKVAKRESIRVPSIAIFVHQVRVKAVLLAIARVVCAIIDNTA